jgi:hypothetical protein
VVLCRQLARLVKTGFMEINLQSTCDDVINDLPKSCGLFPLKGITATEKTAYASKQ